jgi:hypothetical protein
MATYLRFASEGGEILVETDAVEPAVTGAETGTGTGELPAGLGLRGWARTQAGEVVAVARTGFEDAVRGAIGLNVGAFLAAAEALPEPPAELEITFGLKGTGEVGNVAVGKVAGECSYQVTMVWRREAGQGPA